MATLEVDFDVFKMLTNLRRTEEMTYSDVIRELLKSASAHEPILRSDGQGWVQKGVTFPNGTTFRAIYKNVPYVAQIEDGRLILNGKEMNSLSEAAHSITNTTVNGWRFWHCRLPNSAGYVLADTLKK